MKSNQAPLTEPAVPNAAERQPAAKGQSAAANSSISASANRCGASPAHAAETNGVENLRSTLHTRLLSSEGEDEARQFLSTTTGVQPGAADVGSDEYCGNP